MELSNITQHKSSVAYVDFALEEPVSMQEAPLPKRISHLMMKLFEELMPTLQSLNSSSREFGLNAYQRFKENCSSETSHQQNLGWAALVGVITPLAKPYGLDTVVGAATSSSSAFVESFLNNARTTKGLFQEILSQSNQNQSTLQSTLEKFLQSLQQILQTERISG